MRKKKQENIMPQKRKIDESEKEAIRQMIFFAKSNDIHPTEILKNAVNNYIGKHYDLRDATLDQKVDHRTIAIRSLIIDCIPSCKKSELLKLDYILDDLARNF